MPFSFSLVRQTLESIGFELRDSDDQIFQYFYHPMSGRSIIMETDYELPGPYIRDKMRDINLPYEYFEALSEKFKNGN